MSDERIKTDTQLMVDVIQQAHAALTLMEVVHQRERINERQAEIILGHLKFATASMQEIQNRLRLQSA